MKHVHSRHPLFERPAADDIGNRLTYLFRHYQQYVTCKECGKVGLIVRYGKRVIWLPEDFAKRHRDESTKWNAARKLLRDDLNKPV